MSFLWVTIPVSLLVAGTLLALVLHAVCSGDFDDLEEPAWRHFHDDDSHDNAWYVFPRRWALQEEKQKNNHFHDDDNHDNHHNEWYVFPSGGLCKRKKNTTTSTSSTTTTTPSCCSAAPTSRGRPRARRCVRGSSAPSRTPSA